MPMKIVPRGPVDLGGEQRHGNHGRYRHGRIQSVDEADDGRQTSNDAEHHQRGANPDLMMLMPCPNQKAQTLKTPTGGRRIAKRILIGSVIVTAIGNFFQLNELLPVD